MNNFGKLEKITDFSTIGQETLSELVIREDAINALSRCVGLDITFTKKIDNQEIRAKENNNIPLHIISQFGISINDYIAKIVNSAASSEYKTVICIISKSSHSFTRIIKWFNSLTSSTTKFYIVKMELCKKNNSFPTLKYSLLTQPTTTVPTCNLAKLTENYRALNTFWNFFNQYLTYNDPLSPLLYKRVSNITSYDFNIKYCSSYISLSFSKDLDKIRVSLYLGINNETFQNIEIDKDLLFNDETVNLHWIKSSEHCIVSMDMDVINLTNLKYLNTYFNWFYSNINNLLNFTLNNKNYLVR